MKMKIKQINILALFTVFCCFTAFAQKPNPTPKPKSKPKTTSKASVQKMATPVIADANKTTAEEYFKQGQKYWNEIEISKTIDAYTKALELYPNYADALRERGIVFFMTRKNDSAAIDFDAFLKIEPRNAKILYYRGLNYTALAERIEDNEIDRSPAKTLAQKALDDFNLAIQIDSSKAEYFSGRGKLLYNYDNFEKALADFETSVKLEPNSHIAYGYLGMTKFYLGKGGIRELDKAIEIYPSYAESYYNLAKYMEGNNMPDGAFGNYELAIKRSIERQILHGSRNFVFPDGKI